MYKFKEGDSVYCKKSYSYYIDEADGDRNYIEGNLYKVTLNASDYEKRGETIFIYSVSCKKGIRFRIDDGWDPDRSIFEHFSNYFLTMKEYRRQKLERIENGI